MKSRPFMACAVALVLALFAAPALAQKTPKLPPPLSVRQVTTIKLPTRSTVAPNARVFVDYLFAAPKFHTLYAGFATENALIIIDTRTNLVRTSIANLPSVRGIAVVPERSLGFTSNARENMTGVVNLANNTLLRRLPTGAGPDGLTYDAGAKLVYIANGRGQSGTLIDPKTLSVVAEIPLGGKPEFPQADPKTGLIYQNLEDKNEVVVIDPKQKAVTARYPLTGGEEPTGAALDSKNHRLFVGCGNAKLLVMNTDNGKIVASLFIGEGCDAVGYDPILKRIYTANGKSATMSIFRQTSADEYDAIEDVPTFAGAHALAVDPESHRIYVVHGSEITVYEAIPDKPAPRPAR